MLPATLATTASLKCTGLNAWVATVRGRTVAPAARTDLEQIIVLKLAVQASGGEEKWGVWAVDSGDWVWGAQLLTHTGVTPAPE
jgi:hypothetical protein